MYLVTTVGNGREFQLYIVKGVPALPLLFNQPNKMVCKYWSLEMIAQCEFPYLYRYSWSYTVFRPRFSKIRVSYRYLLAHPFQNF